MTVRPLTDNEYKALRLLAQGLKPAERASLLADLENCSVEETTPDGSRLKFYLPNYDRPPYRGQHAYTVGGVMEDRDGDEISVAIYADENNRLLELEQIKWGEKPLVRPDWSTFRVQY